MTSKKDDPLRRIQKLTLPLTCLKGIGPKRAKLLAEKGLHTILDLLFFTPLRYEDRTRILPISETEEGIPILVKGKVVSGRETSFYPSRKKTFRIVLNDQTSMLELIWFHYRRPHLAQYAVRGRELLAYGRIQRNRGQRQMIHPEVTLLNTNGPLSAVSLLGYYPVYPAIQGIAPNMVRSMMRTALDDYLSDLIDPIPKQITGRLRLPDLASAIKNTHFPSHDSHFDQLNQMTTPFRKRLLFDRFFLVMLTMAFRKKCREKRPSPAFTVPPGLMKDLDVFFPFRLTPHQMGAIEDMVKDFQTGTSMNRLILGDVGCGKTLVAAVAAYIAVRNDHQTAVMVPTQELARQHFEYFSSISPKMGFRPVLLTGKLNKAEQLRVYDDIRKQKANLVIGTQSLIQEGLRFAKLGVVVIDEQQRFGVKDRALMDQKGRNPHVLVMTATPIPRTLAITLYGDMDLSFIEGYPEGHKTVLTHLIHENQKRRVFETLKQRLLAGEQAFVICPVIEGSEETDLKSALDMASRLRKIFPPTLRIGLVHGRLRTNEREEVMRDFHKGVIHLLVGTTVIEVGVHVPKATIMVIEHPERFGLSQLHQLRGRVGRGAERGLCLLMLPRDLSEKSRSRLEILAENHDGFDIARIDLEMRGQGELTGSRQAGIGELDLTETSREWELLLAAKNEANHLVDADPDLSRPENGQMKIMVESILAKPLDL
ncbi:MAG: ATP-dependent DNA helicase RecG [Deltaproteobacteria bacterium]|nr:ATP-dependent DNA helicase RecG [Deltaproteobacteria bacterium]